MLVSHKCQYCYEEIINGEPREITNGGEAVLHRDCAIRLIVGSVGHQCRTCSCFGGVEGDPEGMSRREAAHAAADLFRKVRQGEV